MNITRKKREFAELVEIFTLLGSVTCHERDDIPTFRGWKLWCGGISNELTDLVKEWNDDALERCQMPTDLATRLNVFYEKYEKLTVGQRTASRKKHAKDLAEEQVFVKKLDEMFLVPATVEFSFGYPNDNVPLNINGSYLDRIKEWLV